MGKNIVIELTEFVDIPDRVLRFEIVEISISPNSMNVIAKVLCHRVLRDRARDLIRRVVQWYSS